MPPLKGIDRGLNGQVLKALEESGHGDQIVIVDPSYAIPEGARVVDYQGDSSAQALKGILKLVPFEESKHIPEFDVLAMAPDPPANTCDALNEFRKVAVELGFDLDATPRLDKDAGELLPGFYTEANSPERSTIFFRTRDIKAYACAMFIVGHSQE